MLTPDLSKFTGPETSPADLFPPSAVNPPDVAPPLTSPYPDNTEQMRADLAAADKIVKDKVDTSLDAQQDLQRVLDLHGPAYENAKKTLDSMVADGTVVERPGENGGKIYTLKDAADAQDSLDRLVADGKVTKVTEDGKTSYSANDVSRTGDALTQARANLDQMVKDGKATLQDNKYSPTSGNESEFARKWSAFDTARDSYTKALSGDTQKQVESAIATLQSARDSEAQKQLTSAITDLSTSGPLIAAASGMVHTATEEVRAAIDARGELSTPTLALAALDNQMAQIDASRDKAIAEKDATGVLVANTAADLTRLQQSCLTACKDPEKLADAILGTQNGSVTERTAEQKAVLNNFAKAAAEIAFAENFRNKVLAAEVTTPQGIQNQQALDDFMQRKIDDLKTSLITSDLTGTTPTQPAKEVIANTPEARQEALFNAYYDRYKENFNGLSQARAALQNAETAGQRTVAGWMADYYGPKANNVLNSMYSYINNGPSPAEQRALDIATQGQGIGSWVLNGVGETYSGIGKNYFSTAFDALNRDSPLAGTAFVTGVNGLFYTLIGGGSSAIGTIGELTAANPVVGNWNPVSGFFGSAFQADPATALGRAVDPSQPIQDAAIAAANLLPFGYRALKEGVVAPAVNTVLDYSVIPAGRWAINTAAPAVIGAIDTGATAAASRVLGPFLEADMVVRVAQGIPDIASVQGFKDIPILNALGMGRAGAVTEGLYGENVGALMAFNEGLAARNATLGRFIDTVIDNQNLNPAVKNFFGVNNPGLIFETEVREGPSLIGMIRDPQTTLGSVFVNTTKWGTVIADGFYMATIDTTGAGSFGKAMGAIWSDVANASNPALIRNPIASGALGLGADLPSVGGASIDSFVAARGGASYVLSQAADGSMQVIPITGNSLNAFDRLAVTVVPAPAGPLGMTPAMAAVYNGSPVDVVSVNTGITTPVIATPNVAQPQPTLATVASPPDVVATPSVPIPSTTITPPDTSPAITATPPDTSEPPLVTGSVSQPHPTVTNAAPTQPTGPVISDASPDPVSPYARYAEAKLPDGVKNAIDSAAGVPPQSSAPSAPQPAVPQLPKLDNNNTIAIGGSIANGLGRNAGLAVADPYLRAGGTVGNYWMSPNKPSAASLIPQPKDARAVTGAAPNVILQDFIEGRTPEAAAANRDAINGKFVLLDPGANNTDNAAGLVANFSDMLKALQEKGARGVAVIGVNDKSTDFNGFHSPGGLTPNQLYEKVIADFKANPANTMPVENLGRLDSGPGMVARDTTHPTAQGYKAINDSALKAFNDAIAKSAPGPRTEAPVIRPSDIAENVLRTVLTTNPVTNTAPLLTNALDTLGRVALPISPESTAVVPGKVPSTEPILRQVQSEVVSDMQKQILAQEAAEKAARPFFEKLADYFSISAQAAQKISVAQIEKVSLDEAARRLISEYHANCTAFGLEPKACTALSLAFNGAETSDLHVNDLSNAKSHSLGEGIGAMNIGQIMPGTARFMLNHPKVGPILKARIQQMYGRQLSPDEVISVLKGNAPDGGWRLSTLFTVGHTLLDNPNFSNSIRQVALRYNNSSAYADAIVSGYNSLIRGGLPHRENGNSVVDTQQWRVVTQELQNYFKDPVAYVKNSPVTDAFFADLRNNPLVQGFQNTFPQKAGIAFNKDNVIFLGDSNANADYWRSQGYKVIAVDGLGPARIKNELLPQVEKIAKDKIVVLFAGAPNTDEVSQLLTTAPEIVTRLRGAGAQVIAAMEPLQKGMNADIGRQFQVAMENAGASIAPFDIANIAGDGAHFKNYTLVEQVIARAAGTVPDIAPLVTGSVQPTLAQRVAQQTTPIVKYPWTLRDPSGAVIPYTKGFHPYSQAAAAAGGTAGATTPAWSSAVKVANALNPQDPRAFIASQGDPRQGPITVVFGGQRSNLTDMISRQKMFDQFTASGANGILYVPSLPENVGARGVHLPLNPQAAINEVASIVANQAGHPEWAADIAKNKIVLVAYSGGWEPAGTLTKDPVIGKQIIKLVQAESSQYANLSCAGNCQVVTWSVNNIGVSGINHENFIERGQIIARALEDPTIPKAVTTQSQISRPAMVAPSDAERRAVETFVAAFKNSSVRHDAANPAPQSVTPAERDSYLYGKFNQQGGRTTYNVQSAREAGQDLQRYVVGNLTDDFKNRLYAMGKELDNSGIQWSLEDGYRSPFHQNFSYQEAQRVGGVSRPGGSTHALGQAVDIYHPSHDKVTDVFNDKDKELWRTIDALRMKYGLVRPINNGSYDQKLDARGLPLPWQKLDPGHIEPTSGATPQAVRDAFAPKAEPPQQATDATTKAYKAVQDAGLKAQPAGLVTQFVRPNGDIVATVQGTGPNATATFGPQDAVLGADQQLAQNQAQIAANNKRIAEIDAELAKIPQTPDEKALSDAQKQLKDLQDQLTAKNIQLNQLQGASTGPSPAKAAALQNLDTAKRGFNVARGLNWWPDAQQNATMEAGTNATVQLVGQVRQLGNTALADEIKPYADYLVTMKNPANQTKEKGAVAIQMGLDKLPKIEAFIKSAPNAPQTTPQIAQLNKDIADLANSIKTAESNVATARQKVSTAPQTDAAKLQAEKSALQSKNAALQQGIDALKNVNPTDALRAQLAQKQAEIARLLQQLPQGINNTANPFSNKPFDYLIRGGGGGYGKPGRVTEVPYSYKGTADQCGGADACIKYGNLYDETDSGNYPPYRQKTATATQYKEGVPDQKGAGFEKNIRDQLAVAKQQGFKYIEWDNGDGYSIADVKRACDMTAAAGLTCVFKNPGLHIERDEDVTAVAKIAAAMIVEKGSGTPEQLDAVRQAIGRPDMPIWFVSFGDGRGWADGIAQRAKNFSNMSVTYSSAGEYGNADVVLNPKAGQPDHIAGNAPSINVANLTPEQRVAYDRLQQLQKEVADIQRQLGQNPQIARITPPPGTRAVVIKLPGHPDTVFITDVGVSQAEAEHLAGIEASIAKCVGSGGCANVASVGHVVLKPSAQAEFGPFTVKQSASSPQPVSPTDAMKQIKTELDQAFKCTGPACFTENVTYGGPQISIPQQYRDIFKPPSQGGHIQVGGSTDPNGKAVVSLAKAFIGAIKMDPADASGVYINSADRSHSGTGTARHYDPAHGGATLAFDLQGFKNDDHRARFVTRMIMFIEADGMRPNLGAGGGVLHIDVNGKSASGGANGWKYGGIDSQNLQQLWDQVARGTPLQESFVNQVLGNSVTIAQPTYTIFNKAGGVIADNFAIPKSGFNADGTVNLITKNGEALLTNGKPQIYVPSTQQRYDAFDPKTGKLIASNLDIAPSQQFAHGPTALQYTLNTNPKYASYKGDGTLSLAPDGKVFRENADGTKTQVGAYRPRSEAEQRTLSLKSMLDTAQIKYTTDANGRFLNENGQEIVLSRYEPPQTATGPSVKYQSLIDARSSPYGSHASLAQQLQSPELRRLFMASAYAEVWGQAQKQGSIIFHKYMETVMNRALSRGQSLQGALTNAYGRYYPVETTSKLGRTFSPAEQATMNAIIDDILAGSNVAKLATGNESGAVICFADCYHAPNDYYAGVLDNGGAPKNVNVPGTERFLLEGTDKKWYDAMTARLGEPKATAGTGGAAGTNSPASGSIDANANYQLATVGTDGKLTGFGPITKGASILAAGAGAIYLWPTDEKGNKTGDEELVEPEAVLVAALGFDKDGNIPTDASGKPEFAYDPSKAPKGKWEGDVYTIDLTPPPEWKPGVPTPNRGNTHPFDGSVGNPYGGGGSGGGQGGGSGGGSGGGQQAATQKPVTPSQQLQNALNGNQPLNTQNLPPSLTCDPLTVSKTSQTSPKVKVTWNCYNGVSKPVGFNTGGFASGSRYIPVTADVGGSMSFSVSCLNGVQETQSASCSVGVVNASVVLIANPRTVNASSTSRISWSGTNVDQCYIYIPGTSVIKGSVSGATSTPVLKSSIVVHAVCGVGTSVVATSSVTVIVNGYKGNPVDVTVPANPFSQTPVTSTITPVSSPQATNVPIGSAQNSPSSYGTYQGSGASIIVPAQPFDIQSALLQFQLGKNPE